MSAYGYKRTFWRLVNYVRFTPESGHSEDGRKESAYDPKRTYLHPWKLNSEEFYQREGVRKHEQRNREVRR